MDTRIMTRWTTENKPILKKCKNCPKEFWAKVCDIKIGKRVYCSRACVLASKYPSAEVTCIKCEKKIIRKVAYIRNYSPKYCSKSCSNASTRNALGNKFSIESRKRLSESLMGRISWNKGTIGLHPNRSKGKKRPHTQGENNWKWIQDRTKLKDDSKDRNGQLHRDWSRQVKSRDNWKCKIADKNCLGRLEAHHILGWKDYPELRYELNNGITLCHAHHPRKRAEEKRLSPYFQELVSVSKE